jgi:hypothetical protein
MPNGTLKLYNKLTNALLVSLDILSTFNIEDNLNETPSNMKVKVITSNTYREEFEVNTIAYHEDTNSWWVIKSDESSYLTTGEYEHEIQLVELLEFYAYRHLPNCAFAPNTYDLENMLNRLFNIAKLSIIVTYPNFLDKDKIMPFFSFENFTVANAIKNISRSINAIPKMSVQNFPYIIFSGSFAFGGSSPPSNVNEGSYWYSNDGILRQLISGNWTVVPFTSGTITPSNGNNSGLRFVNTATQQLFISQDSFTPVLTFINRNGVDNSIVETLNTQFPIAYEKNMNSNDQFTTRSVSNITNAKSSSLVIAPKSGGFKIVTPNSPTYNKDDAIVFLPSKIDKIDFIRLYLPIELVARGGVGPVDTVLFTGYYSNKTEWESIIESLRTTLTTTYGLTNTEVNTAKTALPNPELQAQFDYGDTINRTNYGLTKTFFEDKLTIKNKFDFDTTDISSNTDVKDRTCHWNPFTNELIMSKTFRYGLNVFGFVNFYEANQYRRLVDGAGTHDLFLKIKSRNAGFFADRVPTEEVLIQVGYYPIADIKISIDNDNDAQDEKFFNQSGKVIDAVSVSKLITSHTNDSVEGTKIRNAKYTSVASILPLGQLVRDSNQIYVVTQRSIDGHVKNGNEYYNVIYTLSRNRIARSENIVADSAVISYKTPDDNLVNRSQLYKDYIELSLQNINQDTPYLSMAKALVLSTTLAGTNFDYTAIAKSGFGDLITLPDFTIEPTTMLYYVKNPTTFDLHKAKLMNVNWQDNNVLGYRLDSTGSSYVQTPIVYTDDVGKATNFELLFLDTANLNGAISDYNSPTVLDRLVPFSDLTQVPTTFYTSDVLADNRFSIRINEANYSKDPFEIPVFEYMIQGNDDYNPLGNIILSNDLFTTLDGTIRYHYIIDNSTRFTAENQNKLRLLQSWQGVTDRRAEFTRTNANTLSMTLYSDFEPSASPFPILETNTSDVVNVGIYAVQGGTGLIKFLFAINDYTMNSNHLFTIYINNWKI